MSRKEIWLLVLAGLLGAAYLHFFAHWFRAPGIQIVLAPPRHLRPGSAAAVLPPAFDLKQKYQLTSVRVAPLVDGKVNKFTPVAWHLVSKSNSVPVRGFVYGTPIPGMHPAVAGAAPEALKPDTAYRLFLEAGSLRTEFDFKPQPVPVRAPAE